jgi:peptide/nickel transport system permease protein
MGAYLLRRLAHMVPLLIGITLVSFLVIDLAPGDFFSTLKMNPSIRPETIASASSVTASRCRFAT